MIYWMTKIVEGQSITLVQYDDSVKTGLEVRVSGTEDFQFYTKLARDVCRRLNDELHPSDEPFNDLSYGDVGC